MLKLGLILFALAFMACSCYCFDENVKEGPPMLNNDPATANTFDKYMVGRIIKQFLIFARIKKIVRETRAKMNINKFDLTNFFRF